MPLLRMSWNSSSTDVGTDIGGHRGGGGRHNRFLPNPRTAPARTQQERCETSELRLPVRAPSERMAATAAVWVVATAGGRAYTGVYPSRSLAHAPPPLPAN